TGVQPFALPISRGRGRSNRCEPRTDAMQGHTTRRAFPESRLGRARVTIPLVRRLRVTVESKTLRHAPVSRESLPLQREGSFAPRFPWQERRDDYGPDRILTFRHRPAG